MLRLPTTVALAVAVPPNGGSNSLPATIALAMGAL
jgi:hypothetical protein